MSEIGGKRYDVMLDEARMWLHEYEPPLRKQKLEAPPSPVEDCDYFSDEEDMSLAEHETYRLQVVESCGFDVDFFKHTFNGIFPVGCSVEDKLFAKAGLHCYNLEKVMDPVNNSIHTFQTLVTDAGIRNKAGLILITKICRIKPQVPGIGDANVFWDSVAKDDFYKCDLPDWPLKDDQLQFYEVKEPELRENEWLYLYAEVALFSKSDSDMSAYTPFEMKKVVVQTKEDVDSSLKLKSSNAIFYMSFKVREGPECRGIVRKISDGRTGHMCLEARCWID